MNGLTAQLQKIPIMLIAILYCGYLAYDCYDWLNSPASELGVKKAAIVQANSDLQALKKKLAQGEEFFRNLDALRARIRQLTAQLESLKSSISSDIDIAGFIRMLHLEAKRLGLSLKEIKPEAEKKKDYYIETPFKVLVRGAYVQVLVFFDRIAKLQQLIRVSDFELKPLSNVFTKYVELESTSKLITYKYLGTQADDVVKKDEMNSEIGFDKLDKSAAKTQTPAQTQPNSGAPASAAPKAGGQ